MSPRPLPTLGRRAAVVATTAGAAAGALGLSGCDVGDLGLPGGSPSQDPADEPSGTAASDRQDDDVALLEEVRAELDELVALTSGLRRRPLLRRSTQALADLHVAHRSVLSEESSDPTPAPTPSAPAGDPGELWAMLLRREREAQRRLAGWAVGAQSGTLARLLASMAAGIAAHLAAAPEPSVDGAA